MQAAVIDFSDENASDLNLILFLLIHGTSMQPANLGMSIKDHASSLWTKRMMIIFVCYHSSSKTLPAVMGLEFAQRLTVRVVKGDQAVWDHLHKARVFKSTGR